MCQRSDYPRWWCWVGGDSGGGTDDTGGLKSGSGRHGGGDAVGADGAGGSGSTEYRVTLLCWQSLFAKKL